MILALKEESNESSHDLIIRSQKGGRIDGLRQHAQTEHKRDKQPSFTDSKKRPKEKSVRNLTEAAVNAGEGSPCRKTSKSPTKSKFNRLRVRTTKQVHNMLAVQLFNEPMTGIPVTNSPLFCDSKTAADSLSCINNNKLLGTEFRPQCDEKKMKIEDFEMGQVIGAGNFAKVMKCFNKRTN